MYSISRNEMNAAIPHLIFSNSGNIDKALIAMTPTHPEGIRQQPATGKIVMVQKIAERIVEYNVEQINGDDLVVNIQHIGLGKPIIESDAPKHNVEAHDKIACRQKTL